MLILLLKLKHAKDKLFMGRRTQKQNRTHKTVSRALLAISSLAAGFGSTPGAWAQEAPTAPLPQPEAPRIPVLNELSSGVRYQSDLIAGQNKPGPYNLSWNNLRVSREEKVTVVMDGILLRAEDYTVDAAKGILTFAKPLTDKQVARVTYLYDLVTSKRNAGLATSQFSLPVTRLVGTQVQVTALPDMSKANATGALPLVWGANRKMNLLGGGLSAQFNYADAKGSGSKLGYALGNDRNGMTADFSRTERTFATSVGKSLGMNEAAQKWAVSTRLAPANWLGVNYGSSAMDDLNGDAGKENETLGLRLGGVRNVPSLAFTRTEDTTIDAKQAEVNVTVEKIALDGKINPAIKLNAATTTTTTDAPKEASDVTVKETAISLDSKISAATKVTAATTTTTTDAPKESGDVSVKTTAVTLKSASKDNSKNAEVTVNTGSKETGAGSEDKQDIKVRLQPGAVFALSASQSELKTTPTTVDGKMPPVQTTTTQTAGAEITPMKGAKLTGSYSETARNDVKVSATDFAGALGTGKRIELTGGITNRSTELENENALDTTRAKIALKPWDALTLTGSYVWNPEDKGLVKQALRQELGLSAKLGALELGSGYALTTLNGLKDISDEPSFGEVSLSLGLRFNRLTRFDGTYRDSLRYGQRFDIAAGLIPNYTKMYGVGLTHGLTDAFNVKLGGSLSEDRNKPKDAKEIKAEAKLGVKF